tara:strand:+ start:1054 stop:1311 length:258 start_codon:yes stop_codon:yes gene_type:complete
MNFHHQEIERNSPRGVPFFICLGVARGKNRKGSQATIPLPLRSAEIFFRAATLGVEKVAEVRKATIPLLLQLFDFLICKGKTQFQ